MLRNKTENWKLKTLFFWGLKTQVSKCRFKTDIENPENWKAEFLVYFWSLENNSYSARKKKNTTTNPENYSNKLLFKSRKKTVSCPCLVKTYQKEDFKKTLNKFEKKIWTSWNKMQASKTATTDFSNFSYMFLNHYYFFKFEF